jgi:hypothetical protein
MTKYYYHDGINQNGPFDLETFKSKLLNPNTLVWSSDIPNWIKASEMHEIKELFTGPPPLITPPPMHTMNTENRKKKRFNYAWLLFIGVLAGIAYYIYYKKTNSEYTSPATESLYNSEDNSQKSAENLTEDLATKEKENPLRYFKIIDTDKSHFNLVDELVLQGKIVCTAKAAKFKDAVIEAQLLSASGTVLEAKQYTRYETWGNGSTVDFTFRVYPPKDTKKFKVQVVGVTPIN